MKEYGAIWLPHEQDCSFYQNYFQSFAGVEGIDHLEYQLSVNSLLNFFIQKSPNTNTRNVNFSTRGKNKNQTKPKKKKKKKKKPKEPPTSPQPPPRLSRIKWPASRVKAQPCIYEALRIT
jgi:hypothetical protein